MTIAVITPNVQNAAPAINADEVIEAMRSIQTETDRWRLAEALAKQIPAGLQGFSELIDKATAEGVAGKLTVNTLRLYRDAANRWAPDKRVPNVSFSAHREAMVLESIAAAAKMLSDLAKNNGPSNVTVASVRKAVAVHQNKAPKVPVGGNAAGPGRTMTEFLNDIKAGSAQLIAAISPAAALVELDQLKAGLTKALAHVERLQAKAARKSQAVKATAATPVTAPTAAKPAAKKASGDLRGL